jgi:hypothetical protein
MQQQKTTACRIVRHIFSYNDEQQLSCSSTKHFLFQK